MHPSIPRLVRIIPRNALQISERKILSPPAPQTQELTRPTLIDVLQQQKQEAGDQWPMNIRIEPVVKKEAFKRVQADVRVRLKKLLKER
jgi:hypothetical protein